MLLLLLCLPAAVAEAGPRVLVTGDSMVQPLDELLAKPVKRVDGRVKRDPRPGTALTRPIVLDWEKHARKQAREHRPKATVMFIGAGDTEKLKSEDGPRVACCSRAWVDAYSERVARMMRSYMRKKRAYVYWLTLPAPRQQKHQKRFLAINFAIAQAAEEVGGKARAVDTVPVLSPGNDFRRKLRYRGKMVVVRDGDGIHLTTAGSKIARDIVVRAMRADGLLEPR